MTYRAQFPVRRGNPWDDLFAPFMGMGRGMAPQPRRSMALTNIYELDGVVSYEITLPGFKEEEVELSVTDGVLTVSATHQERKEEEGSTYFRREFSSSFHEAFRLPKDVVVEDVTAHLEQGVLTVNLPLSEGKDTHRIPLTKREEKPALEATTSEDASPEGTPSEDRGDHTPEVEAQEAGK